MSGDCPQPGFFRPQRIEENVAIELAGNRLLRLLAAPAVHLCFWLRQPQAFCQCSRPADIEKLQSLFLLLRRDQKVCVSR